MPAYGPSLMDQPSEWFLAGQPDTMRKLKTAPYDPKKNFWAPDKKDIFIRVEAKSEKGDDVTCVAEGGATVVVKKSKLLQQNPSKFACAEDMVNMTFLHEAAVLGNLKERYENTLIYTYSGLFCVVINPFKLLPIYTSNVVDMYRGKRKTEVPPHLFCVVDNAYQNMLAERQCQSCLITGESGAGKTENTKKVIAYLAMVSGTPGGGQEKKIGLEEQIVQTNPVLEAFGNAKTVRNNNSSRFGKFIRIHFTKPGKLSGADIESYLLEKSRVVDQLPGMERGYHIFFLIMSNGIPAVTERIMTGTDPSLYHFIKEGVYTVAGMNDQEEMGLTDEGFDILGFANEDKNSVYDFCGGILHMGNLTYADKKDLADCEDPAPAEKAGRLFGVDGMTLLNNILKPRVKVGSEFVTKSQNANQCTNATSGLAKGIYGKIFKYLIDKCNETLATEHERAFFIGVLDIAGFEIFELNSLDQICINYTNEKLQQFFNHHMFVQEQEEYKAEQIDWEFVDFGMDLAACLELIEKKGGLLPTLEEQCIMPKASDQTFIEKLNGTHLGKHPKYGKPKPGKKKYEAHFELGHYAGPVAYNISNWLDKNKDPVNESAVITLKGSKNPLMPHIWSDYQTAEEQAADKSGGGGKRKKSGSMQTVTSVHREQLASLMANLHATYPSFVRCLIPNELKTGGIIDGPLVFNQLTCNGVLEGIRICQKGFPNRSIYADFFDRYKILAADCFDPNEFMEGKEACQMILDKIQLDKTRYSCGLNKVFFKAGTLAILEEIREEKVDEIWTKITARAAGKLQRKKYLKLWGSRAAVGTLQRNIRAWFRLRDDWWIKMYNALKPKLTGGRAEEMLKETTEKLKVMVKQYEKVTKEREELQAKFNDVSAAKDKINELLFNERDIMLNGEERVNSLLKEKAELDAQLQEIEERVEDVSDQNRQMESKKMKAEQECDEMKKEIEAITLKLNKREKEKQEVEDKLRAMTEEVAVNDELVGKLGREKKKLEELNAQTLDDLQSEEDKTQNLTKLKVKLEQTLDDLEDNLEHDKKIRADVDRVKRKLENDLKNAQDLVIELERYKVELEEKYKKKEFEINALNTKVEDETSLATQQQKKTKELQGRIEELEEELETERAARAKLERQRAELSRELEDIGEKLEESSGATAAQVEQNKKREAELQKVRRELEEATIGHEAATASLRKKHNDTVADMTESVENLQRAKTKLEKEKNSLRVEVDDLASNVEQVTKQKVQAEKMNKQLEDQFVEANQRLEENGRVAQELGSLKTRLTAENNDLGRQLEESEGVANQLSRTKSMLTQQMEEVKRQLEEETKGKNGFAHQLRATQSDCDALRESLEEEQEAKSEIQRNLAKANSEVAAWRSKYETDAIQRTEELEEAKKKLAARLQDAEEQVEAANAKCASLEKTKNRLAGEVEDLMLDVEKANTLASQLEKKQRLVDKQTAEWRMKCENLGGELETSQKEHRAYQTELLKLKNVYDEGIEALDAMKKENKAIQEEINDYNDQLAESAKNLHELEKNKKRLEVEKEELQNALDEAEGALEIEQGKVVRTQLELAQLKGDIEKKIAEKEDEFESSRKNQNRAMEGVQASIEIESKQKGEAQRAKKFLESHLNDVEVQLETANRSNAEARKNIAKLHSQIQEMQVAIDDEQRQRDEIREQYNMSERKCQMLVAEADEVRGALDNAERARKVAESQLVETNERLGELSTQNSALSGHKRKLDGDLSQIQSELEEVIGEHKNTEERAKKAMADTSRMAEDLRVEQENSQHAEKVKRTMDANLKDLQRRLDEAEAIALKGGKRAIQKQENRIRELEGEISQQNRLHQEDLKQLRKNERRLKEMTFQADEDRKNQERIQELVEKLQLKIKAFKRQVEEAEEQASSNMAKYRKAQHEYEDSLERAEIAEGSLNKLRSKASKM
ncbi:myosin-7-like [Branchiostoma floridae]|uniref:Myosin-7-like n=5 Tax=Branchiostoma floridae TaxID=7739 RepID=A0A9J7L4M8_BRAFL|nr:myosin-7-like [Branchiostoma floridae]